MTSPWSHYHPNEDLQLQAAQRAQTSPTVPQDGAAHPRSLMPGRSPRTSVSGGSSLFFANQTRLTLPDDVRNIPPVPPPLVLSVPSVPPVPPLPLNLYPAHVVNQIQQPLLPPPPPVPARPPRPVSIYHPSLFFEHAISSRPPPPPLPPKIPLAVQSAPGTTVAAFSSSPPNIPAPLPMESASCDSSESQFVSKNKPQVNGHVQDEAIALSQNMSQEEKRVQNKSSSQEDEDLAKALEASLLDMKARTEPFSYVNDSSSKSLQEATPDPATKSPEGVPPHNPAPGPDCASDSMENITKILPFTSRPTLDNRQPNGILDDEAYARQLAEEEQNALTHLSSKTSTPPTAPGYQSKMPVALPSKDNEKLGPSPSRSFDSKAAILDDEAFARRLAGEEQRAIAPESRREPSSSSTITHGAELPRYVSQVRQDRGQPDEDQDSHTRVRRPATQNVARPSVQEGSPGPQGLPPSYNALAETPTPVQPTVSNAQPPSDGPSNEINMTASAGRAAVLAPPLNRARSFTSLLDAAESEDAASSEPSSQGLVNVNSFVDKELFVGVSVGFTPPTISARLVPMSCVMPNIISLPYGRGAPLHLQGPSWRHLLKLMAKLSGTRLEPTMSALAISKKDLKLRTVIQFVKPYPTAPDWRTVLYFTIDFPSPQPSNHQNVNELPYSYTLAPVPSILHQASDTSLSKTYTIPGSGSVPYPTLPITFPNLATYLQAALDESRRYMNDSSSNYRKLARMVQTCYKSEDDSERTSERSSMSGLFRRVIGRGSRTDRRGTNEETYELVTPFVADEWG